MVNVLQNSFLVLMLLWIPFWKLQLWHWIYQIYLQIFLHFIYILSNLSYLMMILNFLINLFLLMKTRNFLLTQFLSIELEDAGVDILLNFKDIRIFTTNGSQGKILKMIWLLKLILPVCVNAFISYSLCYFILFCLFFSLTYFFPHDGFLKKSRRECKNDLYMWHTWSLSYVYIYNK